ncbi:hypothetical protein METBIDRAFT_78954 [Metschnikowia bicuspidata var. bicuspidata NRRL YB-4993]|uniref:Altered inheritance of mitochondria protein 6 n=1 Tax=Metschnikowia bicuspidata var. bicuspidata NRRL YB-4993 TaxID=869754 RepID=A0A1A0H9R7_9ASCO|nr:hypothetical protein METBIDRAFT_78954 [Metschnikowia bicuspidata var. bicuspidata NRRL YB-4993]OBA20627.1 hypothetical protein METBIDRAFT_78954 [Metschnikowia bicuspidata var. bicuspidata NRRL YB-4993]
MINVYRPVMANPPAAISVESLTRDVHLKPIHSHNDYWRKRPFLDALLYGCISIEADIWRFPKSYTVTDTTTESTAKFDRDDIYVGHNQVHLKPENTLRDLYLDPLYRFLESANNDHSEPILGAVSKKYGVFFDSPELTLNLWLDLKTNGSDTYLVLKSYLREFTEKQYLSHFNNSDLQRVEGPVAVTLTGDVPWALIELEDTIYDIRSVFLDCPLHQLVSASEQDRQRYGRLCLFASASLEQLIGTRDYEASLRHDFGEPQRAMLKEFFDAAHAVGLKARIWGGVDWPVHVRNMHWKSLWELGCDLINADDLESAAQF